MTEQQDQDELAREIADLDTSTFQPHPDGYICRCGMPERCVCRYDFPLNTINDLINRHNGPPSHG